MIATFADTFYFIALLSPRDAAHLAAVEFTDELEGNLVTTAWILTELADGMAATGRRAEVVAFIRYLQSDPRITIVPPETRLFEDGIALYESRPDKEWSLTDCISFVVMQELGVSEALTGDHHFEQAGFQVLLK